MWDVKRGKEFQEKFRELWRREETAPQLLISLATLEPRSNDITTSNLEVPLRL
jgi:hypothetical protein